MKKNISKRILSTALCLTLMVTLTSTVMADGYGRVVDEAMGLTGNAVMIAHIPDVNETGENLRNDTHDGIRHQATTGIPNIFYAGVENDRIYISGNVNGVLFQVEGDFSSISQNGNILVFDAVDVLGNFRVVHCAVERNIADSILYFRSFVNDNPQYDVATRLYLAPYGERDFFLIELFGNTFPMISEEAIDALPEDHFLNLFWYAREFEPISVVVEEEEMLGRTLNSMWILLAQYTFNQLGMPITHNIRFEQSVDIRGGRVSGTSTANATMRVRDKWVASPGFPNNEVSGSSSLMLRDIRITYLTRTHTAVTRMMTSGEVTIGGRIVTNFSPGLGVGLKGPALAPSLSVTWQRRNVSTQVGSWMTHTNTATNLWRAAEAHFLENQVLDRIGNHASVMWDWADFGNAARAAAPASVVFDYLLYNQLFLFQSHRRSETRTGQISIVW